MSKTKIQAAIVIIGAGGHAKELASYIHDLNQTGANLKLLGFIDENKPRGSFAGSRILGDFKQLKKIASGHKDKIHYITAVGDNLIRLKLVKAAEALKLKNLVPWTLKHPHVLIGKEVEIGEGCSLCPGSIITTHVTIGKHSIVNVHASISHDAKVGEFTNINPGVKICGNVTLGKACYIGAGATIIDKIAIGDNVIIGAGAVVTKNISSNVTAVGTPAQVIKKNFAITV